ncbi:MAG: HAD family hydrolase [Candidatus Dormibacteria bacterium]
MPGIIFPENVIAVVWDFDQTLIPGYQQTAIFDEYGIDSDEFWRELADVYAVRQAEGVGYSEDAEYLNRILTYVQHGKMPGLSNEKLRELGGRLKFYQGMPEFMRLLQERVENDPRYRNANIRVEHYVVTQGLKKMVEGSTVAPSLSGIWGCEFSEGELPPGFDVKDAMVKRLAVPAKEISQVSAIMDSTGKTRALFQISKGSNVEPGIGVNDDIAEEDRRVPFANMLYIADGPSDIPAFSLTRRSGGRTLAVYNPASVNHRESVRQLAAQHRVDMVAPADYRVGSPASDWIGATVVEMAERIVAMRQAAIGDRVKSPGGHVTFKEPKVVG